MAEAVGMAQRWGGYGVDDGAGFEAKVCYEAELYHQNMAIAHLFPNQVRYQTAL